MKKIFAFVEKNDNGFYQISCDESWNDYNFGGYGHSVEEAKADFMDSVEEAKEMAVKNGIVSDEEIVVSFKYDLESFFNYFDWINVTKLARIAGINESKMRQYKAGLAYASEKTARKLLTTIRRIGAELQAAEI